MQAPLRHYVIARTDLPPGVVLAQAIHAAGETGPATPGTYAIALGVPDEGALLRVAVELLRAGVTFHLIRETGGPHDGQAMAIGVAPCHPTSAMKGVLSSLPLWR